MNRPTRLLLCFCFICSPAWLHCARAQAPVDAIAQSEAYQRKFQDLARVNGDRLKRRDELKQTYQSLLGRLAENDRFLEQSMGQAVFLSLGIAEAENAVYNLLSRNMPANPQPGWGIGKSKNSPELDLIARLQVEIDLNTHILSTINLAGQLGIERRIKILGELQSTVTEYDALQARLLTQFQEYWELADVDGSRTSLELKAALHELESADDNDEGAQFAKAITLLRLQQTDDAAVILDKLVSVAPIRAVVRAAQAEVAAIRGDKKELKLALRDSWTWGQKDWRVRVHRARAMCVAGDFKDGEHEWETVLKSGHQVVIARQAIALINVSFTKSTEKQLERAVDASRVAAQLAPDNWMSPFVQAFVEEARNNRAGAVAKLEAARDLATDSNKTYCADRLDAVNAGQALKWDFMAFAKR